MVRGLDVFREHFADFERSFIIIGGAACDRWFTAQGLTFRATRDLDIVILIEALDRPFVAAMSRFVEEGGYTVRQRSNGAPALHRFAKPHDERFPLMIELFGRTREDFEISMGQTIVPLEIEPDHHSLSAILLDQAYYELIQTRYEVREGLRFATVAALIPLKARAWIDLTERRERGEGVDARDVEKHRNDVFRLAATLPGESGEALPDSIRADLVRFLAVFPEESGDWPRILESLRGTFGRRLAPGTLREAIRTYFRLEPD